MADVFNLVLQVQGAEKLVELQGLIKGLGTAGAGAERSLEEAAKQTQAIQKGFQSLAKQFKSSFNELSSAVQNLATQLDTLKQKARPETGKTEIQQLKEQADATTVSVRQLRAEKQKLYESQIQGSGTLLGQAGFESPEKTFEALRRLRDLFKVQLSPLDSSFLEIGKGQLKALEDQVKKDQRLLQAQVNSAKSEQSFLKQRAAERAREEAEVQRRVAATIAEGQALQRATEQASNAYLAQLAKSAENERAFKRRRDAEREREQRDARARVEQTISNNKAEIDAAREQALAWQKQQDQVDDFYRRVLIADRRFATERKTAQGTASKQLNIVNDVKAWTEAGRPMEEIRARFGDLAVAAANNTAEYDRLSKAARDAGDAKKGATDAARAATAAAKPHADAVMKAGEAYNYLHTGLRGAAGAMGAIWLTWGKPLAVLWAGFASVTAVKAATTSFLEFQNQLTFVGAVAGETEKAVSSLGESIRKQSQGGLYTGVELAKSARVLTQAGLSVPDAQAVLPTVSRFSTVGELSLDTSAQSLIGISSAFGKGVGGMADVADRIGKAAAISQTSIENMTSSLKVSSVVAEQYGADLNEVSAILAVLAKRNIDASAAGTALRNAYTEIYAPTDKAKNALKALGISAYDASTGQMKPMIKVFEEMRVKVQNFTKESQNAIFQTIFGERGGKVASALLNDAEGLKKALAEIESASGFVDNASLKIESSLKNRAISAINSFKDSLLGAGEAAAGPMSALIAQFDRLASSPALANALQGLVSGLASLATEVLRTADVLGVLIVGYLGAKGLGAVLSMGAGLLGLVGQFGLLNIASAATSLTLKGQSVTMAALIPQLGTMAAASTAAATATTGLASASAAAAPAVAGIGTAMATFGTLVGVVVPALAAIALAVWGGVTAWNAWKSAKDGALEGLAADIESGVKSVEKRLASAVEKYKLDYARFTGKNITEDDSYIDSLIAKIKDKAKVDENAFVHGRGKAAHQQTVRQEADRQIARLEDIKKQLKAYTGASSEIAKAEADRLRWEALKTGKQTFTEDEASRRSYPSAIGTRLASERNEAKERFEMLREDFDLRQRYQEAFLKNGLTTEERYTEAMQQLARDRADALVAEATVAALALQQQKRDRLADIDERVKDPKERANQIKAANAEYDALELAAQRKINSAQAQAKFVEENAGFELDAFQRKRIDSWQKGNDEVNKAYEDARDSLDATIQQLRQSIGGAEELRKLRSDLSVATEQEKRNAERRFQINRAVDDKIAELRKKKSVDPRAVGDIDALERARDAALANLDMMAQLEAQARKDPFVGLRVSASRMLNDAQNIAEQTGRAFENAFGAAEEAVLQFVKTGKFSMRSLADSVMQDLARMAMNQAKSGILSLLLGGRGYSAAGGGGVAANAEAFGLNHIGGMVGASGITRSVDPSVFFGAKRYHMGGLVGDEVPIIAKRGERVLTPEQNRAYESGGGGVTVNQTINVQGGASSQDVVRAAITAKQAALDALVDAQRRGRRRP